MAIRDYEVWDSRSGNCIFRTELLSDAVLWMQRYWWREGDVAFNTLTVGGTTHDSWVVAGSDLRIWWKKQNAGVHSPWLT